MLNWIKSLFCIHNWEVINSERIAVYEDGEGPIYHKYIYTLYCKKCGRIKIKKCRT